MLIGFLVFILCIAAYFPLYPECWLSLFSSTPMPTFFVSCSHNIYWHKVNHCPHGKTMKHKLPLFSPQICYHSTNTEILSMSESTWFWHLELICDTMFNMIRIKWTKPNVDNAHIKVELKDHYTKWHIIPIMCCLTCTSFSVQAGWLTSLASSTFLWMAASSSG